MGSRARENRVAQDGLRVPSKGEEVEVFRKGRWELVTVLEVRTDIASGGFFRIGPSDYWGICCESWRWPDTRLTIS
jgi:hypothetical protein